MREAHGRTRGNVWRAVAVAALLAIPLVASSLDAALQRPRTASSGRTLAVPILMYHHIGLTHGDDTSAVSLADFRAQMNYLATRGGHTITPGRLIDALDNGTPLPARPVILTFDDGNADFATLAAPVLHEHGFTAVAYIVSGTIGRPGYMTAAQIRDVTAMGMVIGSHSLSHPDLAGTSTPVTWRELAVSKLTLERITGTPVVDFAYPWGTYSDDTITALRAIGYRDAVTTAGGDSQHADSPFTLTRAGIYGGDALSVFAVRAALPAPPGPSTPGPSTPDASAPGASAAAAS